MTTVYEDVNSMEKFGFVAGTQFTLNFQTFEQDGVTPLNLTAGSVAFRLAYLGQPENSVVLGTCTITDALNGIWDAVLETADTEDLSGVFVGQPQIADSGGDEFTAAQGEIVIFPKNQV